MAKRVLAMFLALVLVLGFAPTPVSAVEQDVPADVTSTQETTAAPATQQRENESLTGTAYLSISDDARYVTSDGAISGTVMAYVPVDLAALSQLDLADYNLQAFDYDSDGDGKHEITVLHLFLYVLDRYYSKGTKELKITGSAGSMYMENGFWGHDENLTYYVDGKYPLAGPGWGSTADQIPLSNGTFVDVAMYTDWSFFSDDKAGFHYFVDASNQVVHSYEAAVNKATSFMLARAVTDWSGSYSTSYTAESGAKVYYAATLYQEGADYVTTDSQGNATITFPTAGTWYLWADGLAGSSGSIVSSPAYASVTVVPYKLEGSGTQEDPYLLRSAEDLTYVSSAVAEGTTFADTYFQFAADITLPTGWTPIGSSKARFSGHINGAKQDGGNYLLTIPAGEKTMLGCTVEASLKNLDIYGERINGAGVVDVYTTGKAARTQITIENVTLKSGSKTKYSGFVGGYSHGNAPIFIYDCTIEKGVTIGDDGSWGDMSGSVRYLFGPPSVQENDMIASFGGAFNGVIRNSVSYANVYGHSYIGGIVAFKGQSMGDCIVENCEFAGNIVATGNYVGGIVGSGYHSNSAPNTPCLSVQNCLFTGTVSAADYVGGILGAEPGVKQNWGNGIGYIQNNLSTGTITATSGSKVGGVIGYLNSYDRYQIIQNNYYLAGTASKGVGEIAEVLRDDHYGRSDDPTGADADKMASAVSVIDATLVEKLNSGLNSSNLWKLADGKVVLEKAKHLSWIKGVKKSNHGLLASSAEINFTTTNPLVDYQLELVYSDGTTGEADISEATVNGIDWDTKGYQLAELVYRNCQYVFGLNMQHDHNYQPGKPVEPTCTEQGYTPYSCGCGNTEQRDIVAPLGHIDADSDALCDRCGEKTQRGPAAQDENGVYLIATANQLIWLQEFVNAGNTDVSAKLAADIDLRDINWIGIGTKDHPFAGTFDGNGHTIRNMTVSYEGDTKDALYCGLFGSIAGTTDKHAIVKNLTLTGSMQFKMSGSGSYAFCGGLTGAVSLAEITDVTVDVAITLEKTGTRGSWAYLGGFAGRGDRTVFTRCENKGDITGLSQVAGFVGGNGYEYNRANWVDVSFVDCVNSGDIRGTGNGVAGFIGEAYHTEIQGCINSGNVTTTGNECAGFVARGLYGTKVKSSINTGNITAAGYCGALIGESNSFSKYQYGKGLMENCYNTGTVTGATITGGLVGKLDGSMRDYEKCSIRNCYNVGTVVNTGTDGKVGTIIGHMHADYDNVIENNYALKSDLNPIGALNVGEYTRGGLNAVDEAEMRSAAVLASLGQGFKADGVCKQQINRGYPILTWQKLVEMENPHEYEEKVVAPTCTEKGYTEHTCKLCGDTYRDTEVAALGHDFGQWTQTKAPTCTETGEERRDCSRCDAFETREIEATGHEYEQKVVAPTCTADGYTQYTCTKCGHNYRNDFTPALGHDYQATVVAPTCTTEGYTEHVCSRCGDTYRDTEVAALGHDLGQWAETKAATCTEAGEERRNCSRCDVVETREIEALGHDFGQWTQTKAPTCTETGEERRNCSRCDVVETRVIEAAGHQYVQKVIAPTCTTEGYTQYTCTVCGHNYRDNFAPALGHDYQATVVAPTCTEAGYTEHVCAHCGDTYRDSEVAALGHDLGQWTETKAATCTEAGEERRDCSRCDVFETRVIEALGHAWSEWASNGDATVEHDGTKTRTCSTCGETETVTDEGSKLMNPFVDVQEGRFYYDAVLWAVAKNVTNGKDETHFMPNDICTRAEVVTFLWRAAGCPAPKSEENPFADISENRFYYEAVLWAAEEGITNGVDETHFAPDRTVSRGEFVTFLWRYHGEPEVSGANPFADVPADKFYSVAVLWAYQNGVTNGVDQTHFAPTNDCTRGQVVTFLYRQMNQTAE